MNSIKSTSYNHKKILIATLSGLLCLFFSGQGLGVHIEDVQVNIVWSVVFPFLIALAWGVRYALIAAVSGGAWFPFFLWANNGYANLGSIFLLFVIFVLAGYIQPAKVSYGFRKVLVRVLLAAGVYVLVALLIYTFFSNKLMSFNPPFWRSSALDFIEPSVLRGFMVKDTINYVFIILFAELLLHLPVVRKILFLDYQPNFRLNHNIFVASMLTAGLIWLVFISLDKVLFNSQSVFDSRYYFLMLMVIVWSAILVARSVISLAEQRLEAENAFKQKEEEFRVIFESINVGIGITDLKGRYRFFNKWWQQKLGLSASEMEQIDNSKITHPQDMERSKAYFSKIVRGETDNYSLEKRFMRKDGSYFWGQLFASAINDNKGKPVNIAGVINDITQSKEAEQALIREKLFSSRLIETLPGIFYLYTYPDLRLVLWNSNHEKLLGFAPGEIANRYLLDWIPQPMKHLVKEAVEFTMSNGQNDLEGNLLAKDGSLVPFLMTGIRFETKDQLYLLGVGIDIRDKKRAEDLLYSTQQRQNAMIANIADVIAVIDKKGVTQYKSPNIEKWFGWKPEDLVGEKTWSIIHPEDMEIVKALFDDICKSPQKSGVIECRVKNKEGDYKWIEAFAVNCIDSPEIGGVLVNYHDISERKKSQVLEQEVVLAKKGAEFKQKFLANMSHEIRTPLTGVMGMADILAETNLDRTQRDYLNTLVQSGENLKEIINLILDYSKIEAGKVTLKNIDFSIDSLAKDAESFFSSLCSKPVRWNTEIDSSLPAMVRADKHRISQIIRNFVSNAVKFTDAGSIVMKMSTESIEGPTKDGKNELSLVKVQVEDTGKGIPLRIQHKLFEPFFQVEQEYSRNTDGTGLGLAICKELTDMLGGQIGFESTPGKGSRFWFTFRYEPSTAEEAKGSAKPLIPSESTTHSLDVLLVEDKIINRKVISLMLKSLGHQVRFATNGQEALKTYKPGLFDLILMDIQMPVMDGIAATKMLREMHSGLPPIIGLSANAFEGDREKYMNEGLDEYITKPVNLKEFQRILANFKIAD